MAFEDGSAEGGYVRRLAGLSQWPVTQEDDDVRIKPR